MVKKDIASCSLREKASFAVRVSNMFTHTVHTHISVDICAGLQTEKGVHHCSGSNEVHLSRLLEDGL